MAMNRALESGKAARQAARAALVAWACAAAALALGGCDFRDCALGISHKDCGLPEGSAQVAFPQDDAICRSYGLTPGTHDYAVCRNQKRHVRQLTERATDYGFLEEPLLPDARPVYQVK